MKVFGFAGYSGSGKTTLIERLLPWLRAQGFRLAVIKQSHHDVDVDRPGKDSWRHRRAGAGEILLTSPRRWMLIHELEEGAREPALAAHLARLSPCDLVLVEGFRHGDLPKLEVRREALGRPRLHETDGQVVAVASDIPYDCDCPCFHLDDVEGIGTFILTAVGLR